MTTRASTITLLLFFFCLTANANAFTVGFFVLEPHAMTDGRTPTGAAIQYLRDIIAPEMGETVEFHGPYPFPRLLFDFQAGKYDALLLLAKNAERELKFTYPAKPYGTMQSTLLVGGDFPDGPIASPRLLDNMVIGYAQKAWKSEYFNRTRVQFELVSGRYATPINLRKFAQGRIDGVYNPDKSALEFALKSFHPSRSHKLVAIPTPPMGFYTVFSHEAPPELVKRYEAALERVRETIPYSLLLDAYLAD